MYVKLLPKKLLYFSRTRSLARLLPSFRLLSLALHLISLRETFNAFSRQQEEEVQKASSIGSIY
jgi:hypothetical protein